jgi:hypothetical protein
MGKQVGGSEKMVQSADERIKILHHRITQGGFGQISAEGAVRNTSSDTLRIEIRADFFDASGTRIGSEVETIKHLWPGYSTAFEVAYCSKNRYLITDVRFSVKAYSVPEI